MKSNNNDSNKFSIYLIIQCMRCLANKIAPSMNKIGA